MKIKSQKDFFCRARCSCVVGIAFAWGATTYNVGERRPHGPGLLPADAGHPAGASSALVIIFEALVVETEDGEPIGKWAWKPLVFIIGANLAFGVLLGGLPSIGVPAMGLIVAHLRADPHRQPGRRRVQAQGSR